jgi:hypothetical protein
MNRLDAELSRHLRPVIAPDELWDRIEGGAVAQRPTAWRWHIWAVAAAAAAMLALCFSLRSDTTPYLERLAASELAAGTGTMDLRSHDPAQIRAWVKANAGLDVRLPGEIARSVQILGVTLLRGEEPVACISYRVGGRDARLLVARGSSGSQHHAARLTGNSSSWTFGRQMYALAWSAPLEGNGACILCHLDNRAGPHT